MSKLPNTSVDIELFALVGALGVILHDEFKVSPDVLDESGKYQKLGKMLEETLTDSELDEIEEELKQAILSFYKEKYSELVEQL